MKASKLYLFNITVEGRGDFPLDMLRYDHCVPSTSEEVAHIVRTMDCGNPFRLHKVQLRMYSANTDGPTVDRWKSFGWQVVSVEPSSL